MKALEFWLNHQELKIAEHQPSAQPLPSSEPWLQTIKTWVVSLFMTHNEPFISSTVDASGRVWWNVYNPKTRGVIWFDTEVELLEWLDRYPYV